MTNVARVDPAGSDETGAVGFFNQPFLTVQGALDAIEALDPIPPFPVVDIGNNDFSAEDVTTSLSWITFLGRQTPLFSQYSENNDLPSGALMNSPFGTLTVTPPDPLVGAGHTILLKNVYKCTSITFSGDIEEQVVVQLSNASLDLIENLGTGSLNIDGGNTGQVDTIYIKAASVYVSNLNIGHFGITLDSADTEPGISMYFQNCVISDINDTGDPPGISSIFLKGCSVDGGINFALAASVEAFSSLINDLQCDSASFTDSRIWGNNDVANPPISYDDRLLKSVPPGGTTGQALGKVSNDDFDTAWQDDLI